MRTITNSTRNTSTKSANDQQRKSFSNNLVILTGNLGKDAAFFGERRPVGADDRKDIGTELDIVIWRDGLDKTVVEGRLLSKSIELEQGNSPQFSAWVHLVRARIEGRDGVQTIIFGHLKGLEDASESEVKRLAKSLEKDFNPSAKLANIMRDHLRNSSALVARDGVYTLAESVTFAGAPAHRATYGIVRRRS